MTDRPQLLRHCRTPKSSAQVSHEPRLNADCGCGCGCGCLSAEFQEFGHIPPQLYIRASNRLVGDYVMTQNNIANPRNKPDSIGVVRATQALTRSGHTCLLD